MKQKESLRLIILDNNASYAEALGILAGEEGVDFVGHAPDDITLIELAKEQQPDIVLYDLFSTTSRLQDLVQRLAAVSPDSKLLVVNYEVSKALLSFCLYSGAYGLVDKSLPVQDLVKLACRAKTGEKVIGYAPGKAA